jgi:Outer membrane protein beta-barrel domain
MKKIICVIVISLFTLQVWAQGLEVGIKAGLNISNTSISQGSISVNGSSLAAFHGGVYFKIGMTEKISIQPELLYSVQGYDVSSGGTTVEQRLTYIQLPVLFRYNIVPEFNLHAGPQYSYLANADVTVGSNTSSDKDSYTSGDFGFAFGGGFDLPGGFNGGIRYIAGISNVAVSTTSVTAKNSVIQIYVGFKLK